MKQSLVISVMALAIATPLSAQSRHRPAQHRENHRREARRATPHRQQARPARPHRQQVRPARPHRQLVRPAPDRHAPPVRVTPRARDRVVLGNRGHGSQGSDRSWNRDRQRERDWSRNRDADGGRYRDRGGERDWSRDRDWNRERDRSWSRDRDRTRWVEGRGHDRYYLARPWEHGRFRYLGPRYRYSIVHFELGARRLWLPGGFLFEIAAWDWPYASRWCWTCDEFAVYLDPGHPGWYFLYDARLGERVHVRFLGG